MRLSNFFPVALFAFMVMVASAASAASSQKIDMADYSISPASINIKSYMGAFQIVELNVFNKRQVGTDLVVSAEGPVTEVLKLSNASLKIPALTNLTVSLTFLSTKPGEFDGKIMLLGGISQDIPVTIKISGSSVPTTEQLQMNIDIVDPQLAVGRPFKAILHMENLLTGQPLNVSVGYFLRSERANDSFEVLLEQENMTINTSFSALKAFETNGIGDGDYVFEARADYDGNTLSSKSRFKITLPLLEKKMFGLVAVKYALLATISSALMAGGIFAYRKNKLKKRRYVSKLYIDQLPKPGPRSITLGKIAESARQVFYDLDQLQMHTIIAGSTGGGKTVSAQVLIEEALLKGVSVIVFDPTAQWTGFLRKNAERKMLALYPNFGMKPSDAKGFNGNVRQINDKREIIDIRKFMRPGEITCFAINKLEPEDIDVIVANTVRQVFKAHFPESKELKLLIVFDEVHRLLPKFGGSGQGFLQIERAAREFRKWGVGLFLISQVLTDFAGEIKANISTEVQMRTRDQGDLDRIKTKYGDYMLQSLLKSATGTGMVENTTYNRGEPFFVSFRPLLHNHAALPDDELANYNKYNLILDEIDFLLDQLKAEGIDVFDIELEAKLSKDKLKTGNFNMVDIYLESVRPRIDEEWKKLGKKPKEYHAQLVSDDELKAEQEIAMKAKQKLLSEEEKKSGGKAVQKQEKPDFRPLRLKNGLVALNPRELEEAMQNLTPEQFKFHLDETKNDFADWALGPEPELANKLRQATTKEAVQKALQEFQQQKKA